MSDRDQVLGEALRGLDVPDHGPDFRPRLMARLEKEAPATPGHHFGPGGRARCFLPPPRPWSSCWR